MTAFKRAEDRKTSYVLRLFNPMDKAVSTTVALFKLIKRAWLTDLNEKRQQELEPRGNALRMKIGAKKIVTVEFRI